MNGKEGLRDNESELNAEPGGLLALVLKQRMQTIVGKHLDGGSFFSWFTGARLESSSSVLSQRLTGDSWRISCIDGAICSVGKSLRVDISFHYTV